MHKKVYKFAESMNFELIQNQHKGNWETFLDKNDIMKELHHHLDKLETVRLTNNDPVLIKEHIADCANILMFLGNAYKFYEDE
jgi:hypothetical protein